MTSQKPDGYYLSTPEYIFLKNIKKPRRITDDERDLVSKLAREGLVNISVSKECTYETASLTHLGNTQYNREKILRSPIRRLLYRFGCKLD